MTAATPPIGNLFIRELLNDIPIGTTAVMLSPN